MTTFCRGKKYIVKPLISGSASITGTVKVLTTPASKPVYLFNRKTLKVVAETRSDQLGNYSFNKIKSGQEWLVLGLDDSGAYNATVADRVTT